MKQSELASQREQIYEHMLNIGPITALIALEQYGCMRLGARIWELIRLGVDVRSRMVTKVLPDGRKKRYKEYWLGGRT